jgi:hypothetical protein
VIKLYLEFAIKNMHAGFPDSWYDMHYIIILAAYQQCENIEMSYSLTDVQVTYVMWQPATTGVYYNGRSSINWKWKNIRMWAADWEDKTNLQIVKVHNWPNRCSSLDINEDVTAGLVYVVNNSAAWTPMTTGILKRTMIWSNLFVTLTKLMLAHKQTTHRLACNTCL